jgi:hypothetical protein
MSEKKEFNYEIGGKNYQQRPLVLGQLRQLIALMPGITLTSLAPLDIINTLGDKLSQAIAIVLVPEGIPLKDKEITTLAVEIEFSIDPETVIKVVEDFFVCNPIHSLLERLAGMTQKINEAATGMMENGSKISLPSSPPVASISETVSSGDSL